MGFIIQNEYKAVQVVESQSKCIETPKWKAKMNPGLRNFEIQKWESTATNQNSPIVVQNNGKIGKERDFTIGEGHLGNF